MAVSTGSIKLRPAFITKKAGQEYDKLENQTKKVIAEQILEMITKIDFEDSQEKLYFENKATKTNSRKDELLEIHSELSQIVNMLDENDQN